MHPSSALRQLTVACALAGASLSVGCAPASVEGTVAGEAVGALSSASFTENQFEDNFAGTTRTVVTSTAIGVLDGCNVTTELQKNRNDAFAEYVDATDDETDLEKVKAAQLTLVETQADDAKSALPATYWTAVMSASAADEDDIEGSSPEIDIDDFDPDQDVIANVRLCRVNAHPVVGEDSNDFPVLETDEDCFVAASGDAEFETFVENQQIVAHATVKLVDAEDADEDAGEITLHISATHCPSLEAALTDFEELIDG